MIFLNLSKFILIYENATGRIEMTSGNLPELYLEGDMRMGTSLDCSTHQDNPEEGIPGDEGSGENGRGEARSLTKFGRVVRSVGCTKLSVVSSRSFTRASRRPLWSKSRSRRPGRWFPSWRCENPTMYGE